MNKFLETKQQPPFDIELEAHVCVLYLVIGHSASPRKQAGADQTRAVALLRTPSASGGGTDGRTPCSCYFRWATGQPLDWGEVIYPKQIAYFIGIVDGNLF